MKTVIETSTFIKTSREIMSEIEIDNLIEYVSINYNAGDVIPGGNGLRKLRWSGKGTGKRGGNRIIYLNMTESEVVLLLAYRKKDKSDISPNEKKKLISSALITLI